MHVTEQHAEGLSAVVPAARVYHAAAAPLAADGGGALIIFGWLTLTLTLPRAIPIPNPNPNLSQANPNPNPNSNSNLEQPAHERRAFEAAQP